MISLGRVVDMEQQRPLHPFWCDECQRPFTRRSHLIDHKRIHANETPFCCEICEKRFHKKSSLKEHILMHTGEKKYCCEHCGKTFIRRNSFMLHCKHVHSADRENFTVITKFDVEGLPNNLSDCPSSYSCKICGQSFEDESSMKKHYLTVHACNVGSSELFCCNICGEIFITRSLLIQHHRAVHNQDKFYCELCGRFMKDERNLINHQKSHTNAKPFLCVHCGKLFSRKQNLKAHVQHMHNSANATVDLEQHDSSNVNNSNTDTNQDGHDPQMLEASQSSKQYICHLCGRRFQTKGGICLHRKTKHADERPFKCVRCNRDFNRKCSWERHLLRHSHET